MTNASKPNTIAEDSCEESKLDIRNFDFKYTYSDFKYLWTYVFCFFPSFFLLFFIFFLSFYLSSFLYFFQLPCHSFSYLFLLVKENHCDSKRRSCLEFFRKTAGFGEISKTSQENLVVLKCSYQLAKIFPNIFRTAVLAGLTVT